MYYHASSSGNIVILEPRISNHDIPLIYFSQKRQNVLVYLSNAIEKFCRETNFEYCGKWQKWGPYGFNQDGTQRIEEYYPNALEKTYRGVSGYIYTANYIIDSGFQFQIPYAATSSVPVMVDSSEFIPDAYEAILDAEKKGLISILRYEDSSESQLEWNKRTMRTEYDNAIDHPDYRHFIKGCFPAIFNK